MSSVSSADGGYSYYSKPLNDLESEMKDEARRTRERYDERADSLEKNYRTSTADHDRDTEETLDRYREDGAETAAKARDFARAEVEKAKAQTYDKYGRAQSEIAFHKKRADDAIRQSQEELTHTKEQLTHAAEEQRNRVNEAAAARENSDAWAERDSRAREVSQARTQVKDLIQAEKTYMKEKGQGTVDAHRSLEGEARTREHFLQKQYEAEIANLKRKLAEGDRNTSLSLNEERHDRDLKNARMVQRITQDNEHERKTLQINDQRAIDQQQELTHRQARHDEMAMNRQADDLTRKSDGALRSQAKTYNDTLQRHKEEDDVKMGLLEKNLRTRMTSPDPSNVSPAAEAAISKSFTDLYEKKHQAEVSVNKEKTDSIQRNYGERLTNTVEEAGSRVAAVESQRRSDEHVEQQLFTNHIDDIERDKNDVLRRKDDENAHHEVTLNRTYSNSMEKQRKEYEGLLTQAKLEDNERLTNFRQQADFKSKMAQREFSSKRAELSKSYERKMEDQKNGYEDTIATLKDQIAQANRDAERRTQKLLDDQQKGYEQKIAQMEYTRQERERTISDSYQDQIEKLKRSNALLIQRKSEKS